MLANLAATALTAASDAKDWISESGVLSEATDKFLSFVPTTDLASAQEEAANAQQYDDNCCYVYDGRAFTDDYDVYCLANGSSIMHEIASSRMNDRIASYACGKNVLAKFCHDGAASECRYNYGEASAGTTNQVLMGHHDSASSIKMYPYDALTNPAVTLFDGLNCEGTSGVFFGPQNGDGVKKIYNKESMWVNNVPKNSVASVMIPYGLSLKIYEHDGTRGLSTTMNGEWFKDENNLEASCQNLPSDWYDRQGSIEVFRTGTVG